MGGMLETLRNAWKIPDLRKKILFTVVMLLIYRIGSHIPVPGLDPAALADIIKRGGSLFGFMDIVTGGAFKNATIFAMSITPYINSSIIMQLLTVAIPSLERLAKEGDEGRKIIAQYTRYGTVVSRIFASCWTICFIKKYNYRWSFNTFILYCYINIHCRYCIFDVAW